MTPASLIFGAGYSGRAFARANRRRDMRSPARRAHRRNSTRLLSAAGIEPLLFDGEPSRSGPRRGALARRHAPRSSRPRPDEAGDPVLVALAASVLAGTDCRSLGWIGYLSTVGVYGDHGGAWVDETATCRPVSRRSVHARRGRTGMAARSDARPAVCRSPCCGCPASTGRAAMPSSTSPTAPPGGWSSPARCSTASTSPTSPARSGTSRRRSLGGVFNVTDDEPAPPQDVVAYAAELMGVAAAAGDAIRDRRTVAHGAVLLRREQARLQCRLSRQAGYRLRVSRLPQRRSTACGPKDDWRRRRRGGRGKPDRAVVNDGEAGLMLVIWGIASFNVSVTSANSGQTSSAAELERHGR